MTVSKKRRWSAAAGGALDRELRRYGWTDKAKRLERWFWKLERAQG